MSRRQRGALVHFFSIKSDATNYKGLKGKNPRGPHKRDLPGNFPSLGGPPRPWGVKLCEVEKAQDEESYGK